MRRYYDGVKDDVPRQMGPPHRQIVAEISKDLGIHLIMLYKWRKAWRLQGEVVPATQKDPEGWGTADMFFSGTGDLRPLCDWTVWLLPRAWPAPRAGGPLGQAAQDANAMPLLTMADQKDHQKRKQEDQREIKRMQQRCAAKTRA